MINLISEAVIASALDIGVVVKFVRSEERSKQFAPYFIISVNDKSTNIGFNTEIINNSESSLGNLVAKIVEGLLSRIAETLTL